MNQFHCGEDLFLRHDGMGDKLNIGYETGVAACNALATISRSAILGLSILGMNTEELSIGTLSACFCIIAQDALVLSYDKLTYGCSALASLVAYKTCTLKRYTSLLSYVSMAHLHWLLCSIILALGCYTFVLLDFSLLDPAIGAVINLCQRVDEFMLSPLVFIACTCHDGITQALYKISLGCGRSPHSECTSHL